MSNNGKTMNRYGFSYYPISGKKTFRKKTSQNSNKICLCVSKIKATAKKKNLNPELIFVLSLVCFILTQNSGQIFFARHK